MATNRLMSIIAVFALILLVLLAWQHPHLGGFNRCFAATVNARWQEPVLWITAAGSPQLIALFLFFLAGFAVWAKRAKSFLTATAATLAALVSTLWLKNVLAYTRPDNALYAAQGAGFPSAHSAVALTFYGLMALDIAHRAPQPARRIQSLLLLLLVLMIGWSRLALGVHYATDVIGGYLVGIFWLAAARLMIGNTPTGLSTDSHTVWQRTGMVAVYLLFTLYWTTHLEGF